MSYRTLFMVLLVLGTSAQAVEVRKQQAVVVNERSGAHVDRDAVLQRSNAAVLAMKPVVIKAPIPSDKAAAMSRKSRPETQTAKTSFIDVYDASVSYGQDDDGDGFYASVNLALDIDSSTGPADVYVKLYYRVAGGNWEWFYTSGSFHIDGATSADVRRFNIQLDQGFSTDWYEWAVDVYETGYAGVVATLDGSQDADLMSMPLEDRVRDSDKSGLYLDTLGLELSRDDDGDGFYSTYVLNLGVYFSGAPRRLQAIAYSRGGDGQWYQEAGSVPVLVIDGDHVNFTFEGNLSDGWESDYYDLALDVVDADTGQVLFTIGPESSVLAAVPLEGANWDAPVVTTVVTVASSGGSLGWFMLFLLAGIEVIRRRGKLYSLSSL